MGCYVNEELRVEIGYKYQLKIKKSQIRRSQLKIKNAKRDDSKAFSDFGSLN
jgi:hypothetical protein